MTPKRGSVAMIDTPCCEAFKTSVPSIKGLIHRGALKIPKREFKSLKSSKAFQAS